MPDALIFDLDDTLCPERPFVLARLGAVARHLRERYGPVIDFRAELVRGYEADLRIRVFDAVLERAGLEPDPDVIRDLVDLYRRTPAEVAPYPDTVPALAFWSARLPLGLVTDGYGPTQRRKVDALGIERYFRAIVYTHDLGPDGIKPSAVPFRRVQEAIGFAGPAVYVGDNPRLDFPAPKRLGWATVRIARPGAKFAGAEADPAAPPDHVIESLDALRTVPPLAAHVDG
ncbi:MAG: HAD family hydrolase [Phycisphaerae bacterium]